MPTRAGHNGHVTQLDSNVAVDAARKALEFTQDELVDLARIPSISSDPERHDDLERSARRTTEILHHHGLEHVEILRAGDAHPAVYGDWLHAGDDKPTLLLYAHHDVQPPGVVANWTADPFDPTERDGRLYARGICDDKAGVLAHAAAVSAWLDSHGALPLNVKILIEGEEEIGSPNLESFLTENHDKLRSDVFVLADAGQWDVGEPAITFMLRGIMTVDITLLALKSPVHSGMHGGAVPDPAMALAKLCASLVDDYGDIAVRGFHDDVRPLTEKERAQIAQLPDDGRHYLRVAGAIHEDLQPAGNPEVPVFERLWARPALTIIGFDSHPIAGSSNQIVARATARVSVRLAPGQDPRRCEDTLRAHVAMNTPWGIDSSVLVHERVPAWTTDPHGPAFEACERALTKGFGREPVLMGIGGSVPFVGPFVSAFGNIPALLIGPEDPYSRAHGEDESLHLDDWRKLIESEIHLFAEL